MFRARVERDSISLEGMRLTTVVAEFPRVVLGEAVTHRLLSDAWEESGMGFCERFTTKDMSKNSASSRAMPTGRMLEKVRRDPYMPQWTALQKGMQGKPIEDVEKEAKADGRWLLARDQMASHAEFLHGLDIHKQDVNRLIEPWAWVTQVITATWPGWANFFHLRCDEMAHPAIQRISRMLYLAMCKSIPTMLQWGQWHLPFVPMEDQMALDWRCGHQLSDVSYFPKLLQFSAARVAWVSYENHDKDGSEAAMLSTFSRLVGSTPKHASPLEAQGTPYHPAYRDREDLRSNLSGWLQLRKLLKEERATDYSPSAEVVASWGIDEDNLWPEG